MNKKFELSLYCRSSQSPNKFIWHDNIKADSAVELFGKLLISTSQMMEVDKAEDDRYRIGPDDDIPF